MGEESDRSKGDFTYPSEEKIFVKPRHRILTLARRINALLAQATESSLILGLF